jgi:hypothetical protein
MPISMFLPGERDRPYLQLRHACWMRLMPPCSCGSERTGGISKHKGGDVDVDVEVDVDITRVERRGAMRLLTYR